MAVLRGLVAVAAVVAVMMMVVLPAALPVPVVAASPAVERLRERGDLGLAFLLSFHKCSNSAQ
jgi:hypothetical protein